jgi:sRNA-binding protein
LLLLRGKKEKKKKKKKKKKAPKTHVRGKKKKKKKKKKTKPPPPPPRLALIDLGEIVVGKKHVVVGALDIGPDHRRFPAGISTSEKSTKSN